MWDFFLLIVDQLGNSFKWGFIGFLLGVLSIYLLKKGKILKTESFLHIVKISVYYILYPICLASLFWLYAATKHLEKDVYRLSNGAINKMEENIYPVFNQYITRNLERYIHLEKIPTNDQIVSEFLNETRESSYFTKKVVHPFLVETLIKQETIALKKMGIPLSTTNLTVLVLSNNNTSLEKNLYSMGFQEIKGFTIKQIAHYLEKFYTFYYILFGILFVIILLEVIFGILKR